MPTPSIFVSATSIDLAKARETVRDALLEIGCFPVVQQHFATGAGEIAPKEAGTIAGCKAVIHLAGRIYGEEPIAEGVGVPAPRRSYTQREYDAAVANHKPVYVFLALDAFYQDGQNMQAAPLPVEDAEKQLLQQQHCAALRHSNNLWYEFSTLDELRERVLRLPERNDAWARMFKAERRTNLIAASVIVVLITAGTIAILRQSKDTPQIKAKVVEVSGQVSAIDATLGELQKLLASQPMDPEVAIGMVSAKYGLTPEQLKSAIRTFVSNYDEAPNPTPVQRDLRNVAAKFVIRGNTPVEFASYVESVQFTNWRPSFIVLHSTESPLQSWMKAPERALSSFYDSFVKQSGWTGGPHLFVDENKIWVFNALNMPGVHATTWNRESIGVEMVGQYDTEPLSTAVRDTTVSAIASLCRKLSLPATAIRFHNEQQPFRKTCPGKNVSKEDFIQRVTLALSGTSSAAAEKPSDSSTNAKAKSAPSRTVNPAQSPADDKATAEIMPKVVHIIVEQLGVNSQQVKPSAKLIEDLGADSVDLVELIMAVEEEFKLDIPDDDAEKVKTVDDMAKLVARKGRGSLSTGKKSAFK